MSNVTISPNMSLPVPTLTDPGPDYAGNVNSSLGIIDGHTHTGAPTDGKQLDLSKQTTTGDIQLADHNLGAVRSVEFQNQPSQLVGAQDVNCLYVNNGVIGWNNSLGVFVPLGSAVTGAGTNFIGKLTSTNYTILPTDNFDAIFCNSPSASITITLPVAAAIIPNPQWRFYLIKDVGGSAGTNPITIQVSGGSGNVFAPNGNTVYVLNANCGFVGLFTDGSNNWYVYDASVYYGGEVLALNDALMQLTGGAITLDASSFLLFDNTTGSNVVGKIIPGNIFGHLQLVTGGVGFTGVDNYVPIIQQAASGVQSGVVAGISSVTDNGICLTGSTNDWIQFRTPSGGTQYRSKNIVFPLIPWGSSGFSATALNNNLGEASYTAGNKIGWFLNPSSVRVFDDTSPLNFSGSQYFILPVSHNGATISQVSVMYTPPSGHSALPANLPTLQVKRMQFGTGLTPPTIVDCSTTPIQNNFNGGAGPATSVSQYENGGHTNTVDYNPNQNNVVDSSQYFYYFILTAENGANSISGFWQAYSVRVEYVNILNWNFVT